MHFVLWEIPGCAARCTSAVHRAATLLRTVKFADRLIYSVKGELCNNPRPFLTTAYHLFLAHRKVEGAVIELIVLYF